MQITNLGPFADGISAGLALTKVSYQSKNVVRIATLFLDSSHCRIVAVINANLQVN